MHPWDSASKWHDSTVPPLQKLAAVEFDIFQPVSSRRSTSKSMLNFPMLCTWICPASSKIPTVRHQPGLARVQPWRVKESQCPPENSRGQYIFVQDHVQELKSSVRKNQGHSKERSFMAFQSPNKKSKEAESRIWKRRGQDSYSTSPREDLQISTWKHVSLWLGKSKLKPQEGLPWWSVA